VPKTVIALVVIGLVWIGYMAWPLYELTALVRAIDARDVSTVARYANFDRVRVPSVALATGRLPFITWASLRLGAEQLRFAHGRPGRL
jgi:hypothetical protein